MTPAPRTLQKNAAAHRPEPAPVDGSATFTRTDNLLLAAIVLFAFAARFYHLGTPSLWWDEILVPLTARYPLEYIFSWAKRLEVNSPYYVILVKGVLLSGRSDFCLRLPSALAGAAAVWVLARLGARLLGRTAGLTAALLLAAWPLHILLSRQLRPYGLFVLVLLLATGPLLRLVREETIDRRNLLLLALAYMALFGLHFMAVPVALSHGVFVLLAVVFLEKGRLTKGWCFLGAALVGFVPIAPFFLGTFLHRNDMLLTGGTFAGELAQLTAAVHSVFYPLIARAPLDYILPATPFSLVFGGGVLVLLAGLCLLAYRRQPALGLFFAASLFVPLLFFLLFKQPIWRPRHLSFLLPPLALALGEGVAAGLAAARLRRLGPAVLVALGCLLALPAWRLHPDQLYGPRSYPDVYKSQARELSGLLRAGEAVAVDNPRDFNALSWYLDRFQDKNPMDFQALGPGNTVTLQFVAPENFAKSDQYQIGFMDRMGKPDRVTPLSKGTLYTYAWTREARAALTPYAETAFSAKPWVFYRAVASFADVTAKWQGTPYVHPTRNTDWARFEKGYRVVPEPKGAVIEGEIDYFSDGLGNAVDVDMRLDGGSAQPLLRAADVVQTRRKRFKYVTDSPVRDIDFAVRMRCGLRTPLYPGSNLDSVGFEALRLRVVPLEGLLWGSASLVETFTGLDPRETAPEGAFRWGHGPETACVFQAGDGETIDLDFAFTNILPDQTVQVVFNGSTVATFAHLPPQKWLRETVADRLRLTARQGENRLVFRYAAYNGLDAPSSFAPGDSRPLAVAFTRLRVEKEGGGPGAGLLTAPGPADDAR